MNDTMSDRFALTRIDDLNWVITDAPATRKGARTIARVSVTEDDHVQVVWTVALPLPTTYVTAQDAVESLEAWAGPRGATKPIPIAHYPPPHEQPRD